ncbi:transcription initiation protein [Jiangella ureilytica]|uniref:Transcription initiation protein n=1 Tax=Jiangella ureilytica TaxID=2530374 RepID=A0A4R4RYY1_9ACTN|nr:YciI family protein [Jiangella ureilytica]TDC54192.1 transcription initiation protein [Jiangella ureilytica]
MKYMLMMFGDTGTMMATHTKEQIEEMIGFMIQLDKDLEASGELVFQQGLADPSTAKTVVLQDALPVVTDGPFAEAKESLIGFWVVDVESEERVIELAGQIVRYSGRLEIRVAMDAPEDL